MNELTNNGVRLDVTRIANNAMKIIRILEFGKFGSEEERRRKLGADDTYKLV